MSDHPLQEIMFSLESQASKWRKSRKKRDLYAFLAMIFLCFSKWKRDDVAEVAAKEFAKLAGIRRKKNQHPIRTMINATTKADRRTKSRLTRALKFAWVRRKKYKSAQHCLRANGGVAGCAEQWAFLQAATQTPKGYVRVGGEDRVPKIPYFVSTAYFDEYGRYRG